MLHIEVEKTIKGTNSWQWYEYLHVMVWSCSSQLSRNVMWWSRTTHPRGAVTSGAIPCPETMGGLSEILVDLRESPGMNGSVTRVTAVSLPAKGSEMGTGDNRRWCTRRDLDISFKVEERTMCTKALVGQVCTSDKQPRGIFVVT